MPAECLERYTIRCANLERTCEFYRGMLGLTVGDGPDLNFKGLFVRQAGCAFVGTVR